jgi:hypothetical protein
MEIKHRAPQGSVFGTLLYLLHLNELLLNIQDAKLVLFADDINILIIDKNTDAVQARQNRVLNNLKLGSQIIASLLILIKHRQCYFT